MLKKCINGGKKNIYRKEDTSGVIYAFLFLFLYFLFNIFKKGMRVFSPNPCV